MIIKEIVTLLKEQNQKELDAVVIALASNPKYVWREFTSLMKETKLSKSELTNALTLLIKQKLVAGLPLKIGSTDFRDIDNPRWGLTMKGRQRLQELSK